MGLYVEENFVILKKSYFRFSMGKIFYKKFCIQFCIMGNVAMFC